MTKLERNDFKGIKLDKIEEYRYIDKIKESLHENIPYIHNWANAVSYLRDYLNNHDFVQNEGYNINDESINKFISRLKINERKNDNSNFLPIHKEEMTQQQVNPLEQLVQNTISVQDLISIYNRYAPTPITEQQLQVMTNGNANAAKAYLINEILSHARDGTLVRSNAFGRTSERKGMGDIAKIVLDLPRDIKRVKNAISPQGAQRLVDKHNATAKHSARWRLNKRNQNGRATLANLTDINKDGVPDVVITNANNQPVFINGYNFVIF
mgnify:CR=1 FL=1